MKKSVVLAFHLVYWLVYSCLLAIFYGLLSTGHNFPPGRFVLWAVLMLQFAVIPGAAGFYCCYTFLFSRFLAPRRIGRLVFAGLGTGLLATWLGQLLLALTFPRIAWKAEAYFGTGIIMLFNVIMNGLAGLGMRSFIVWYRELKWKEELSRKNHEMEMGLVHLRLSPHFLFNTINNIDTLILQNAELASHYLNKLSQLLRFMLYEAQAGRIPLSEELSYMGSYMELQRIRTSNAHYATYSVRGDPQHWHIAPMLFIPFMENAFKHATNKRRDAAIRITLDIRPQRLVFDCVNECGLQNEQSMHEPGIGNELIRKRLQLLYPQQHTLSMNQVAGQYHVKLYIDRESH